MTVEHTLGAGQGMRVLVLQPPSPPHMNVKRDYAGGMGVADPSPRLTYGHDPGYIILPYMSLLYTAAVLEREGFMVSFVDAQTEGLDVPQLLERISAIAPQVLVSVVNLPSLSGDLALLRMVRERFPTLRIVVVGTVAGPLFSEIASAGVADAIVRGDAEVVLSPLLMHFAHYREWGTAGWVRRDGVLTNERPERIENLDALPELPYHLVPVERYWYHVFGKGVKYAPVFASRGCAFRCYYCPYPMGFGERIVYRDPVRVVGEIERLQRKFGVQGVLFRDQVFSMDWDRTRRLCEEIIRRRLNVEWVVETRLDRVNGDILRWMKRAGCKRIHYGLESGDPRLFSRVGKDQAAGRMEQLIRNFALTERLGIGTHMFILIGLLGEDWRSIRNTIRTIRRIKPPTLQVSIVTPYPGTPLFEQARAKGLILTQDWSQYTGFRPVMRTEALSAADLLDARRLILTEHRRAVRWKRCCQQVKLLVRYFVEGSLAYHLMRALRPRAVALMKASLRRGKLLFCEGLFHTGAVNLLRGIMSRFRGPAVRILSVHRVIDDDRLENDRDLLDLERGCLSLREFRRRVLYLKKHYTFISLPEYVERLRAGHTAEEDAVILTFDDGFRDGYLHVRSFLRQEGIPWTLFVTTGFIGTRADMLSWDEVMALALEPGVALGAHSVSHRSLTSLSPSEMEKEIVESRQALETRTGRRIDLFCYPDGKYDDKVQEVLRRHGFLGACATGRTLNVGVVDVYALKRIPFEREPMSRFALRMAGVV